MRLRSSPRKRAQQTRSKATVERILDAAARVLTVVGYDRASTKRIAVEAELSIGSLYQYFPSKEAVVAALLERHATSVLNLLQAEVERLQRVDLPNAVHGLVTAFYRAQHVDARLRRVFIEQVPRIGRLDRLAVVEARAVELARAYLEARPETSGRRDLDLVALVIVRAISSLTYQALVDPGGHSERTWIKELGTLVLRYLC